MTITDTDAPVMTRISPVARVSSALFPVLTRRCEGQAPPCAPARAGHAPCLRAPANMLLGRTAERVALTFKSEALKSGPQAYVASVMRRGLICAISLKDTARHSLIHKD